FIALDPRLAWQAPGGEDHDVVVQVFGFRYPADASVSLAGGDGAIYRLHLSAGPRAPDNGWLASSDVEPNNTASAAASLELPAQLVGAIREDGDEDRFRIACAKDAYYEIRVEAASHGSPLDAWLRVEDPGGKELASNDDSEGTV